MRQSVMLSFQGLIWKIKTFLYKRWITLQDRMGWYGYPNWIRENELPSIIQKQPAPFKYQPVISCLIDLQHALPEEIEHTLASFAAQTYNRWEVLCFDPFDVVDQRIRKIIDDNSQIRLLEGDSIEALFFDEHGFKSTAQMLGNIINSPDVFSGEYIFSLRVGDTIAAELFWRIVEQLNRSPEIDLFYTDEDRLSRGDHIRHSPFFKPNWSPELLYSVNYLKPGVIRVDHLRTVIEVSDAEAQYDDLIIRCADEASCIYHIPEIMVHLQDDSQDKASDRGNERFFSALIHRLQSMGLEGVAAHPKSQATPHLVWSTPEPLVSIIIPTRDCLSYLQRALESIQKLTTYSNYEFVIVDNESRSPATHQYYEQLRSSANVTIVPYNGEFNFSSALNLGANHAIGDVFLFLNNDIEIIEPEWLTEIVRWVLLPEIGVVGAKLLFPDGKIQHAGIVLGMEGHASHVFGHEPEGTCGIFGSSDWYRNYSAVTGACMAIRRDVFEAIGGFDPTYQLVFSDVAICLQAIKKGYRVMYNPFARLIHHEGRTRSKYIPSEDIVTGFNQLKDMMQNGDPYYNPNLSTSVRNPTFRREGEEPPEARLAHILKYFGKS